MKRTLLSILAMSTVAMSANAQLYDQSQQIVTNGVISAYMSDNDTIVQCADDFTVPVGSNWSVTSVTVQGFRNNSGTNMNEMTVELWADSLGPSSIIYSEDITLAGLGVPTPQLDTSIVLDLAIPQVLATGKYWLSVYGKTEAASRWNWTSRDPAPTGDIAMLLDADDYFGSGVTDWVDLITLGLSDPDLCFVINGTDLNAGLSELSNEVSIFPNPAADVVNIEFESSQIIEKVDVFNIDGKLVRTMNDPASGIDVSGLPTGAYILEVATQYGVSRAHFMKK